MLIIYKGDDSDFADLGNCTITIRTDLDLTGFTGKFCFMDIEKQFSAEEIAHKTVVFNYTAEETATFPPGRGVGVFHMYDPEGRHAAVYRVCVEVALHRRCSATDECVIEIENAFDYNKTANKPQINGVTLIGDVSSEDLGIPKDVTTIVHRVEVLEEGKQNKLTPGTSVAISPSGVISSEYDLSEASNSVMKPGQFNLIVLDTRNVVVTFPEFDGHCRDFLVEVQVPSTLSVIPSITWPSDSMVALADEDPFEDLEKGVTYLYTFTLRPGSTSASRKWLVSRESYGEPIAKRTTNRR